MRLFKEIRFFCFLFHVHFHREADPNIFDSLFVFLSPRLPPTGAQVDEQTRVVCPNCHRTYKSRKLLYRHLRQGCGEIVSGYSQDQPCPLPVHRCPHHGCPYITFIRGFLNRHAVTAHGQTSVHPSSSSSSHL
jgi:hypothetical protein